MIKRTINLYRIEKLAVIFEFIDLTGRVEVALPGSLALWIRPDGCTDVNISLSYHIKPQIDYKSTRNIMP